MVLDVDLKCLAHCSLLQGPAYSDVGFFREQEEFGGAVETPT